MTHISIINFMKCFVTFHPIINVSPP
jgi:hypothetical protein